VALSAAFVDEFGDDRKNVTDGKSFCDFDDKGKRKLGNGVLVCPALSLTHNHAVPVCSFHCTATAVTLVRGGGKTVVNETYLLDTSTDGS
jgi:hypothetical protein